MRYIETMIGAASLILIGALLLADATTGGVLRALLLGGVGSGLIFAAAAAVLDLLLRDADEAPARRVTVGPEARPLILRRSKITLHRNI